MTKMTFPRKSWLNKPNKEEHLLWMIWLLLKQWCITKTNTTMITKKPIPIPIRAAYPNQRTQEKDKYSIYSSSIWFMFKYQLNWWHWTPWTPVEPCLSFLCRNNSISEIKRLNITITWIMYFLLVAESKYNTISTVEPVVVQKTVRLLLLGYHWFPFWLQWGFGFCSDLGNAASLFAWNFKGSTVLWKWSLFEMALMNSHKHHLRLDK